ncbi:ParE toxin of type II toxin-antitoxin system, parDE [Ruminococcaceae bacterium YRB3002]|nr:ParE toxin of type II toxin-antitoxin system, parDE [Ruminococcaceae bacterium YRB3002]
MSFSHHSGRMSFSSMSDQYKLIILPEAQKDIREIIFYIARELAAPQAALRLQDEFQKEINSLARMPERIKKVDEQPWKNMGIRKVRVKNYYIYFLVDDEEIAVKVNAVIYVGRDQSKQMTDRKMEES